MQTEHTRKLTGDSRVDGWRPPEAKRRLMRNRHIPRLCRDCGAPMASGEGACWRCGAQWATEATPPTKLRLVPSPAPMPPERGIAVSAPN